MSDMKTTTGEYWGFITLSIAGNMFVVYLGAILALLLKKRGLSPYLMEACNAAAAGLFLAIAFWHILPEVLCALMTTIVKGGAKQWTKDHGGDNFDNWRSMSTDEMIIAAPSFINGDDEHIIEKKFQIVGALLFIGYLIILFFERVFVHLFLDPSVGGDHHGHHQHSHGLVPPQEHSHGGRNVYNGKNEDSHGVMCHGHSHGQSDRHSHGSEKERTHGGHGHNHEENHEENNHGHHENSDNSHGSHGDSNSSHITVNVTGHVINLINDSDARPPCCKKGKCGKNESEESHFHVQKRHSRHSHGTFLLRNNHHHDGHDDESGNCEGHTHGIHHGHDDESGNCEGHTHGIPANTGLVTSIFLLLALSIHAFSEGYVCGGVFTIKADRASTWTKAGFFLLSLVIHKWIEGFVVAMSILKNHEGDAKEMHCRLWAFTSFCAFASPLGTMLNVILRASLSGDVFATISPYVNGVAVGTLLYVAVTEIVPEVFVDHGRFGKSLFKYALLVFSGAGLMLILNALPHSHGEPVDDDAEFVMPKCLLEEKQYFPPKSSSFLSFLRKSTDHSNGHSHEAGHACGHQAHVAHDGHSHGHADHHGHSHDDGHGDGHHCRGGDHGEGGRAHDVHGVIHSEDESHVAHESHSAHGVCGHAHGLGGECSGHGGVHDTGHGDGHESGHMHSHGPGGECSGHAHGSITVANGKKKKHVCSHGCEHHISGRRDHPAMFLTIELMKRLEKGLGNLVKQHESFFKEHTILSSKQQSGLSNAYEEAKRLLAGGKGEILIYPDSHESNHSSTSNSLNISGS